MIQFVNNESKHRSVDKTVSAVEHIAMQSEGPVGKRKRSGQANAGISVPNEKRVGKRTSAKRAWALTRSRSTRKTQSSVVVGTTFREVCLT